MNFVLYFNFSETQDRIMITGRHIVRDVACKKCDTKLGWMYEFATGNFEGICSVIGYFY